jgi:hypothetical protein
MRITVAKLRKWGQCHTDEWAEERFAGRKSLSLATILRMESVTPEDRVWVCCQPGVMTVEQRAAWLERIVVRAVTAHALHCGVPTVEAWAARWLSGEDRSEDAAGAAAWAAWAAAGDAAGAAAWAAAGAAERRAQIDDALAALGEGK